MGKKFYSRKIDKPKKPLCNKWWFMAICIIFVIGASSCSGDSSSYKEEPNSTVSLAEQTVEPVMTPQNTESISESIFSPTPKPTSTPTPTTKSTNGSGGFNEVKDPVGDTKFGGVRNWYAKTSFAKKTLY